MTRVLIEVRVGQVWRDKDKRSPFTFTVSEVRDGRAYGIRLGRKSSVRLDRLPRFFRLERDACVRLEDEP